MNGLEFRKVQPEDKKWLEKIASEDWGTSRVVSKGKLYDLLDLPGTIAVINNMPVGFLIYHIDGEKIEILGLKSVIEGKGIGTALIEEIKKEALLSKCSVISLITTNDNTNALRFYQKRGFVLAHFYPNAIENSRKLKPQIPLLGNDGIPIRDEIELEMRLI